MRKRMKRIVMGVVFALMIFAIHPVTAKATETQPTEEETTEAVKALGEEDFQGSSSWNFATDEYIGKWNYQSWRSSFKTNRNIKIGSKKSTVVKKYGASKVVKFKANSKFHKFMRAVVSGGIYDKKQDKSLKTYMDYTYKDAKSDVFTLRFYFDKKDKVKKIMFIKNIGMQKFNNKKINPKLKFKAPKGQKITKKKMNGRTVYIIPENTKVSVLEKNAKYAWVYKVKKNGERTYVPWSGGDAWGTFKVKNGYKPISFFKENFDAYKYIKEMKSKEYYEICFYDYNKKGGFDAPRSYYFKFK